MTPNDLILFFTEEAQHRLIDDEHTKAAESALLAHGKMQKGLKTNEGKSKPKSNPDEHCENCNRDGHLKVDCLSKGGGKEGQWPRQKKPKGNDKGSEVAAIAEELSQMMVNYLCSLALCTCR